MVHVHYEAGIDACIRCASECDYCAESCRREPDATHLSECIRLTVDCAEMCRAAGAFMNRDSHFAIEVCRLCAEVCEACAHECAHHEHDHCERCGRRCRECADECHRMAAALIGHAR